MRDGLLDLETRRHQQAAAPGEDLAEVPHPVDRALENRDPSAETERDDRRVVANDPAAQDDDVAGLDTGRPPATRPPSPPGPPASRPPRPPRGFSRKGAAPCGASLPAIWCIGASRGSRWS